MYFFYGNVDFAAYFKERGLPVTVVDAGAYADGKPGTQRSMFKKVSESRYGAVVVVTNLHQLRTNVEATLTANYLGDNAKAAAPILGDVRFDYYRQLKITMTTFVQALAALPNSGLLVLTAPVTEEQGMSYIPLKPAGVDEFIPHLQNFTEVVPFLNDGNGNYISVATRAVAYNISKPTLADYVQVFAQRLASIKEPAVTQPPVTQPPVTKPPATPPPASETKPAAAATTPTTTTPSQGKTPDAPPTDAQKPAAGAGSSGQPAKPPVASAERVYEKDGAGGGAAAQDEDDLPF